MKLRLDSLSAFGSKFVAEFPESNEYPHGYSHWEVEVHVHFTEEGEVETSFRVYPRCFATWSECLYACNSFKELKSWLEEHKDEIR